MLPTVAEVLRMPVLQAGSPVVLAAEDELEKEIRWAHVSELEDIAGLLQGRELVLTTGIALPSDDEGLRRYVSSLSRAAASGIVVELGRRFSEVPVAMVRACARHGLPLVALRQEVKFVRVTEAIHSRIVESQVTALRRSEQAHAVFTSLCVDGADTTEIVRQAARMTRAPVVMEDLMHRVLAYEPLSESVEDLLHNWEPRSRRARTDERTAICGPEGWAVTSVEARGEHFGRLVLLSSSEVEVDQLMVLERAAVAVTLSLLLEENRESSERQAHRSVLTDIIDHRYESLRAMHARTAALGVPTARRVLLAVVVQLPPAPARSSGRPEGWGTAEAAASARAAGVPAVVGTLRDGSVGLLLPVEKVADRASVLEQLAGQIHRRFEGVGPVVVAVGTTATSLDRLGRSFAEAEQVATAVRASQERRPYHELPDVPLRAFMYTLGKDPRLHAFVQRTLSPLLDHDDMHSTDLVETLRAYLACGGNKAVAAQRVHLSRQGLYDRLATIEGVLGVSLDSAEMRTSLHAAVMGLESSPAS